MRMLSVCTIVILLAAIGCGGSSDTATDQSETATTHAEMPDDDVHSSAMGEAVAGAMHTGPGINADITLDPDVADDWRAIRVRVVDLNTQEATEHEIAIGDEEALGDSGLSLRVEAFIPDFVMTEQGITSRSAEPQNPAARVVIMESGKDDYEGWLFGAMPEIHAYPHDRYGVVLVEGVPAE